MSSEEVDKKSEEETKEMSSSADENDKKDDTEEEKVNSKAKPAPKKKAAEPKIKQPAKKRAKTEQAEKESKKEEKKKAAKDEPEESEEDEEEIENHKGVPLLDQPLEVAGSRKRKEVERFVPKVKTDEAKKEKDIVVVQGKGAALGNMEVVEAGITRARPDTLKLLHKLCFGKVGKHTEWSKNLKKFNGWDFEEGSDEFERKKAYARGIKKVLVADLKNLCLVLDIEKTGSRDDLMDRILSFLVSPVDSGKKLAKGRSKRAGALAKNYDEGQDTFKTEKKGKAKKKKEIGSEESESEKEDDTEKEKKEVKQNNKKKATSAEESSEPEEEEQKEEEEKPKAKGGKKGKKAAEAVKKAPAKKRAAVKKAAPIAEKTDSEGAAEGDDESEGDEPSDKKSKVPPTDDEIKTYVKTLLEGANLELITMKKVCEDVYAHYPEFDLNSKKDFIKTTVKNLISS